METVVTLIESPRGYSIQEYTELSTWPKELIFISKEQISRELIEKIVDLFEATPNMLQASYDKGYECGKDDGYDKGFQDALNGKEE